jgi:hypothetical protein
LDIRGLDQDVVGGRSEHAQHVEITSRRMPMTTSTRRMPPGTREATPGLVSTHGTTPNAIGTRGNRTNSARGVSTAKGDDTSTPPPSSGHQRVTRTYAHFGPIYPLTVGPTTEYRAEIAVNGLEGGTIAAATVWLPGIGQVFRQGMDLLLMGPSGGDGLRFARGARQDDSAQFDLTFVDAPADTPPTAGSGGEVAVDPAFSIGRNRLAACAPDQSGHTSLAILTSTAPNGIWQLSLFAEGATQHVLFGGWCLSITAEMPV